MLHVALSSFSFMRLRLSHKGLMLVSGVLLFELILVAIFAGLLGRSDQQLDERFIANSVVAHVDNLRKLFTEIETASIQHSSDARFDRAQDSVPFEFNALQLFLKDDPHGLKALEEAHQALMTELERLKRVRRAASGGLQPAFDYIQFAAVSDRFSNSMDQIASNYHPPLAFVTDRATLSRRLAESIMLFVVLINAVVAVATTLFFMQGIVNRLGVVADNSVRFGRGEELNPPLEGSDEIAALDRILHETIKQRTFMEKLLLQSEARTRSLIENMPVGVVTIDEEGNIESINPQIEAMFGYGFDEISGDHLIALFSMPENMERSAFVAMVHQKTLGRIARFESRRKNGEIFPVEVTLNEYDSIDGIRFLAIIQDVTERQKAEQFKQELLSMVSHDLRSPLTSVQGVMTLLGKGMYGQLNDTGEKRIKVAEQSLARLIHLVDDILDLERMEAGRLQFNLEAVPVASIIDRSVELVYDFAEQQHIKFETHAGETEVFVDEDRLVQVIVNLLSNAIKFSPKNSVIKVEVHDLASEVEIRIVDQGAGIAPEHLDNIFQRFHQVDSAASAYKGTGLGLTICKAIVEGHEGTIGVTSEPGKGSSFWFRIPKEISKPVESVLSATLAATSSERKPGSVSLQ